MELIRAACRPCRRGTAAGAVAAPADGQLLDRVIDQVRELNGRDLDDDLAILALSYSPGPMTRPADSAAAAAAAVPALAAEPDRRRRRAGPAALLGGGRGRGRVALVRQRDARNQVVDVIDPAALQAQLLDNALVNQETGVRGYALSAQQSFLAPYTDGLAAEQAATSSLNQLVGQLPPVTAADLHSVTSQAQTGAPATPNRPSARSTGPANPWSARTSPPARPTSTRCAPGWRCSRTTWPAARSSAVATLNDASTTLNAVFIAVAIGLALIVVILALGLRATAIRPLHALAAQARRVAGGDFEHEVTVRGPREVTDLAADVNTMRERILRELSATREVNAVLQVQAAELQRSNSELEQFAYIASHDLQEPLRKVASFSQLLQRRYAGQLDARADQYIEFAVDGAKRMQVLINDLLAYSRVGRSNREPALVSSDAALAQARANLAEQIEQTGATIETGHLPLVLAELPLLTAVFQNLLSNALKFSGGKPPRIVVTVRRDEAVLAVRFFRPRHRHRAGVRRARSS